jgi:hypothetical protein
MKFGNSLSVDITVRLGPVLGDDIVGAAESGVSRVRVCARDVAAPAPSPVARRFRDAAALERDD